MQQNTTSVLPTRDIQILISFLFSYLIFYPYCLQESICNSSDGMLLSAPDSLVVTITKNHDADDLPSTPTMSATPRKSCMHNLGIDGLDSLKFTYKVHHNL